MWHSESLQKIYKNSLICPAIICINRFLASTLAHAMCGVIISFLLSFSFLQMLPYPSNLLYIHLTEHVRTQYRIIVREQEHRLAIKQKQAEVDEARKLAKEGLTVEEIGKRLHHVPKTIQNYLNQNYSVENGHYHVRIKGVLPFLMIPVFASLSNTEYGVGS